MRQYIHDLAQYCLSKDNVEEYNDKKIHVFDSRSASAGELAIVNRIYKLIDESCSFNTIVEKIEYYIKNECTLYAL